MADFPQVRTYVLNFFQANPFWNINDLHTLIRESKAFLGWSNRLPNVYFLMSRLSADEIRQRLLPTMAGANFIVAEINRFNMNGSMPQDVWDWFYSIERAAALPKPPVDLGPPQSDWSKILADILSKPGNLIPPSNALLPPPSDALRGLDAYEEIINPKKPKK